MTPIAATHDRVRDLYSDHHAWLRGWLRTRLSNAFDAADIAHDTFVRVLISGRVPAAPDSRRHLRIVAHGLVVDLHRRRTIESAYLETIARLPETQVPSEQVRAEIIETLLQVDAILDTLPARARTALLLQRVDGLSQREIARRMKVSVSSVEKYIAAALVACYRAMHT